MSKNLNKLLNQLIKLHPKYIDLSLERLKTLLKKLGDPHLNLPPTIHLAGTNGKGSTLSYIRNILIANEYSVHAYISPHLKNFNERIILNNKQIHTGKLIKSLNYVKRINNNKSITFFEITTATAFYLFSRENADFLILETGLGGRLDATNVIKNCIINIITPIGIDHQEFLGDNILKITNEKLGIIKKNSNIVISKQKKIVDLHIKNKLKDKKNNTLYYNKDFQILNKNKKTFDLKFKNKKYLFKIPTLVGEHQIENVSTSLASILQLEETGYSFNHNSINKGIIKTRWAGRLEKGSFKKIKVYLDGAHNLDGAIQLYNYFKNQNLKVWLIIGMLKNKNIYGFLEKLKPILEGVVAIPIPKEKNIYMPEEILQICKKLSLSCIQQTSITKANNYLYKKVKPKVILISGSLYLVGKIREKYL